MNEFAVWLDKMATKPLPGGVSAAALAAAMGAALVAKVAASRPSPEGADSHGRRAPQALLPLAQASRAELVRLAAADEAAYCQVLDTRCLPASDEGRRQAWQRATDLPLTVAETCRRLLADLASLDEMGSPALAVDLEVGRRLLQTGAEAGTLAAQENVHAWGADSDSSTHRRRLAALLAESQV